MSTPAETKTEAQIEEAQGAVHTSHDEKTGQLDRQGAIEAENAEHEMGVLEAVRAYPMATWWAFVMSCTIVSGLWSPPVLTSPLANPSSLRCFSDYGVLLCLPCR
jgi:MFS transporter, SP family, general alpha glucoside:H+ symporter